MAKIELDKDTAMLITILYYNLSPEKAQSLKNSLDAKYQKTIEEAVKMSDCSD